MSSLRDSFAKITQGLESLSSFEFGMALVLGLIKGASPLVKFGHCPSSNANETDIWAIGATQPIYIFPNEAGELVEIVSDNVLDSQEIKVIGLDENGLEKEQVVTLTGNTPVSLSGLWTAVNRANNNNGARFSGTVTIQGDGSTSVNKFAVLLPVDQQTVQAIFTIPSNKVAIIYNYMTSLNRTGGTSANVIFSLDIAKPGKVFTTNKIYGLQKEGTSFDNSKLPVPKIVGPSGKIKVRGLASASGTDLSSEFSMLLVDKELVPTNVLNSLL